MLEESWPTFIKEYSFQIILLISIVVAFYLFNRGVAQSAASKFKLREADRIRSSGPNSRSGHAEDDLSDAKINKSKPLRLGGIRIDGPPHEVLGISKFADKETILNAYRERMKQYHPDKVSSPGSPQWKEAQSIAAAINQAKNALMDKFHKPGN